MSRVEIGLIGFPNCNTSTLLPQCPFTVYGAGVFTYQVISRARARERGSVFEREGKISVPPARRLPVSILLLQALTNGEREENEIAAAAAAAAGKFHFLFLGSSFPPFHLPPPPPPAFPPRFRPIWMDVRDRPHLKSRIGWIDRRTLTHTHTQGGR